MNLLNPEIALEKTLQNQIYNALEGDIVSFIQKHAGETMEDIYYRSIMEGQCMKIDPEVTTDLYNLCMDVKKRLGFDEPVDFYIMGSSEVNADSLAARDEGNPHMVRIFSALYDLMSEDELRCIVGHELGHLINRDTALRRLLRFVYPSGTRLPIALEFKVRLHDQLAELVADRYGYLACGNLEACVTSFFKLSSGIDIKKMGVSLENLLAKNDKTLDFFLNGGGISESEHPVHPIRIQALKLFARARSNQELEQGMDELIQILLKSGSDPMDPAMSNFIATAGIIAGHADGQMTTSEFEHIVETLSASHLFPAKFVDDIYHQDVEKIFYESINTLLEKDPSIRPMLLQYMMEITIADKDITEKEVNFIYNIGSRLGFDARDISQMFGGTIQRFFSPSLSALA